MKIRVLFIQRKERYEGELGPEALCCEDEFTRDANAEWFPKQVEKDLKSIGEDLAGHTIVEFDVDQDEIRRLCLPTDYPVKAKIVGATKEP